MKMKTLLALGLLATLGLAGGCAKKEPEPSTPPLTPGQIPGTPPMPPGPPVVPPATDATPSPTP